METTLQKAVDFYFQGIVTIPVKWRTKIAAVPWLKYQTTKPTPAEVITWFSGGQRNIAALCGEVSGNLVVLDFDDLQAGLAWFDRTRIFTYSVMTARGTHFYFRMKQLPASCKLKGLDIQSNGRYVLCPPSIHPRGAAYRELCTYPIVEVEDLESVLPSPWADEYKSQEHNPHTERVDFQPVVMADISDPFQAAIMAGRTVTQKIRARFNILDLFPDAQRSSPDGRWYMALCPCHQDHNPSLWIDVEKQVCGCRAGCSSKPWDYINIYSRLKGITVKEAIRELGNKL